MSTPAQAVPAPVVLDLTPVVPPRLRPRSCFSGLADRISDWEHLGGVWKILTYMMRCILFIAGYIIPPVLICYNRTDREVAVADFERDLRVRGFIHHPQVVTGLNSAVTRLEWQFRASETANEALRGNVQRLEGEARTLAAAAPSTPIKPRVNGIVETPVAELRKRVRRNSDLAHFALTIPQEYNATMDALLKGKGLVPLTQMIRALEPAQRALLQDALADAVADRKEPATPGGS